MHKYIPPLSWLFSNTKHSLIAAVVTTITPTLLHYYPSTAVQPGDSTTLGADATTPSVLFQYNSATTFTFYNFSVSYCSIKL